MYMLKIALWLGGAVLLVGVGVWLWFGGMLDPLLTEVGIGNTMEQEEVPQQENRATQPQSELTTGSDSSDQALEQDMKNLDAQLGAYGEASAGVDKSLQDEPVTQEY